MVSSAGKQEESLPSRENCSSSGLVEEKKGTGGAERMPVWLEPSEQGRKREEAGQSTPASQVTKSSWTGIWRGVWALSADGGSY